MIYLNINGQRIEIPDGATIKIQTAPPQWMEAKATLLNGGVVPEPGDRFDYNGHSYIALGMEQGGLLAISDGPVGEMPFDEDESNDWRASSLRAWLNGEYLEQIGRECLLKQVSDLTSDDGMKDYGTAEDYVALLSEEQYRKHRAVIPDFDTWWWTITPWSCSPSVGYYQRNVNASGALFSNVAYNSFGVVPRLLFNLESFTGPQERCDSSAE